MDDPISALDANVKKQVFKHVFMGQFKDKTRILVTHAVDFLHLVDSIVLMKNGQVVFKGPYEEVKESAYLKELIRIHKGHEIERNDVKTKEIPVSKDFDGIVEEYKDAEEELEQE